MMRLILLSLLAFCTSTVYSQLFTVNFEDQDSLPVMSENCNDNLWDYFDIVTDSDIGPNFGPGSYLAAQDIDALPCTMNPQSATWSGIDISSCSGNLYLCLDLAEDDDGSNEDWDAADQVLISYSIDGFGFEEFVGIQNDGSTFNSEPSLDTNCDGVGDGAVITGSFNKHCFLFNLNGSTLDLEIVFQLNAGNEDIAIDNVEIYCDTPPVAPLTIVCAAALPVEIAGFEAQRRDEEIDLSWTSSSEVNNDHYAVEHSTDGEAFSRIAEVNGNGNSNEFNEYETIHTNPSQGLNYYRLKQVDFNGAFEYSEILMLRFDKEEKVKVYPTHALGSFTIELAKAAGNDVSIEILDAVGRIVVKDGFLANELKKEVDISELNNGHYFVRLNNGGAISTHRVVKTN